MTMSITQSHPVARVFDVRVFDVRTGVTLETFEVSAADFESALEEAQARIEPVALAAFDQGGEPEVEISAHD